MRASPHIGPYTMYPVAAPLPDLVAGGPSVEDEPSPSVIPFRKFTIKKIPEIGFTSSNTVRNREWAEKDLSKSGLDLDFMYVDVAGSQRMPEKALAVYMIPYFFPDGTPILDKTSGMPIMFRQRFKYPDFSREHRYGQPSGDQLAKLGLPPHIPYIHPWAIDLPGEELICAEGEKKSASIMRTLQLPTFGIGGCWLWQDPNGSGNVHPWILDLIRRRNTTSITIVPDGDVMRYDICKAYGAFTRALQSVGIKVTIKRPPGKIDDLIVEWGSDARARFDELPTVAPEDLVQSPASLIAQYDLSFREGAGGVKIVHQHTSNITRLLENHPAFEKIWRNTDNNKIMIGDKEMVPESSEMDIANHFQHNLGFDKVTSRIILSCIAALARTNERSPFLEWVKAQSWDGKPRLESWMMDYWSVTDSPFVREVSSKWLISSCARLEQPGTKVDWMLIVIGPQGTGKTSMPAVMFKDHNTTLYGEHNDKDLHLRLHSALCVGFDELDSFGKRESSNLKAMVTNTVDMFRPPYGASVQSFPRRFTLYGCGNNSQFLQHDPSGYRRYAIIEVNRLLDFKGLAGILGQLWAEAYTRYKAGSSFWEISGASANAEQYVVESPIIELIRNRVDGWCRDRPPALVRQRADGAELCFSLTDIYLGLGMDPTRISATQARDIGAIVKSLYGQATLIRLNGVTARRYCISL